MAMTGLISGQEAPLVWPCRKRPHWQALSRYYTRRFALLVARRAEMPLGEVRDAVDALLDSPLETSWLTLLGCRRGRLVGGGRLGRDHGNVPRLLGRRGDGGTRAFRCACLALERQHQHQVLSGIELLGKRAVARRFEDQLVPARIPRESNRRWPHRSTVHRDDQRS